MTYGNTYNILVRQRKPLTKGRMDMEENMTDYQFKKLIQMVLMILEKSSSLDEAIAEVKKLME